VIEVNTSTTPAIAQDIMFGAAGGISRMAGAGDRCVRTICMSRLHTNAASFAEARVTGRLAGDPPEHDRFDCPERAMRARSSRWGDYLARQ
jgi:hypothetical protein